MNFPYILYPPFLCATTRKLFRPVWPTVGTEHIPFHSMTSYYNYDKEADNDMYSTDTAVELIRNISTFHMS